MPGPPSQVLALRRGAFVRRAAGRPGLAWPLPARRPALHAGGIHPSATGRLGRRVCVSMDVCVRACVGVRVCADWLGPVFARRVTWPQEGWRRHSVKVVRCLHVAVHPDVGEDPTQHGNGFVLRSGLTTGILERGRGGQTGLCLPVAVGRRPPNRRCRSISGIGFCPGPKVGCVQRCDSVGRLVALVVCSGDACLAEPSTGGTS